MKKLFVGFVAVFLFIFISSFFFVGSIVKKGINEVGPKVLGVPVDVRNVSISILDGSGVISGLSVGNPKGFSEEYSLKLDSISFNIDINSLFSDTIIVKNITVIEPEIIYEMRSSGSNLTALANNSKGSTKEKAPKDNLKEDSGNSKLIIKHLLIKDGKIKPSLAGAGTSIPLSTIEMKDVGKEEESSTADVISEILSTVINRVASLDLSSIGGIAEDTAKEAVEGFKGITEGVIGIFD